MSLPRKSIDGVYYPKTLDEVKAIIQYARENKKTVRTLGSEHSPKESIYSTSDAKCDSQIKVKLNGSLAAINQFDIDEKGEYALVKVGAGCYLGINPMDGSSNKENSFNYQVDAKGFALTTLGGISHQTIAGFLSTSSSGGTATHNIADVVEVIGFIDGTGTYQQCKKGDPLFNAVGVSMGLLGIITDVTFKLPKRYLVAGEEINYELQDSCLAPDSKGEYSALDKILFDDKESEYVHINWFAQKYTNRVTLWHGKAVSTDTPIVPYNHTLSSKMMVLLASGVLTTTNILNEQFGDSERVQKIIGNMFKVFAPVDEEKRRQIFCDTWQKALPLDDQAPVDGLISTSFSEIWFPREQLNEVMKKTNELFKNNPKAAGNLIVELYCAKQSPFWLSPSYGSDALRMDLYWWDHNLVGDANTYFGQFFETFKDVPGVRYHWGKHMPHPGEKYGEYTFAAEHLQKNYDKLGDFLKLRAKLDPDQLFVTDYWRNLLNIPKPWLILQMGKYISGINLFSAKTVKPAPVVTEEKSQQLTYSK